MFFCRLKKEVSVICALVIAVVAVAFLRVTNVHKLDAYVGERTYYLDSASSQSLQTNQLKGLQFLRVKGESVVIKERLDKGFIQEVLQDFDATVLWVEDVDGILSYYCYTPRFDEGVKINNRKVNLHIAQNAECTVIGYPVIFGGF